MSLQWMKECQVYLTNAKINRIPRAILLLYLYSAIQMAVQRPTWLSENNVQYKSFLETCLFDRSNKNAKFGY